METDNSQHDSLHENEQPHLQRKKGLVVELTIDLGIQPNQLTMDLEATKGTHGVHNRVPGTNLRSMHHGIPKTSFIKVEDLLIALQPDISNNYNYICSIIQLEAPRYSTNILGSVTIKAC